MIKSYNGGITRAGGLCRVEPRTKNNLKEGVEVLLIEANIKYLCVKLKKGLKKSELANSEIIKNADNLCVRILLFLFCFRAKDLEKIDVDLLRDSVGTFIDDAALLEAFDYFRENNILDYKYEKADNGEYKGANMDKITNLIGNISDKINNMTEYKEPEATEEKLEFEKIYRLAEGRGTEKTAPVITAPKPALPAVEEEKIAEKIAGKFAGEEKPVEFEKIELGRAELPEGTAEEHGAYITIDMVCEELEKNNEFRYFYEDVQNKLKAIINPNELEILYNLYNKMEMGLLLKISEYCGQTGKSAKTAVNYFEKTALGLADDGIVTVEQYGKMLEEARAVSEYEAKIRQIFALGDKRLSAKERNLIKTWALEYKLPEEMLIEGYRKALERDKATIPYVNTIYLNWHEKGFKNAEDVKNEFKNFKNAAAAGNDTARQAPSGFNSDHFFDKLVRNSKRLLD